ncbi:hypothetical protein K0B96_12730 [Horticoccus luteus]|uniref:Lipoprotein n=1 Tax=Horticoccus luteus TaxID=2862869 RepID=A0A8F9TUS9_9BACT|nr:hypothetical protein [Horticoccus luteus]QYM78168.1 hypothetical protein K0B96_12730 [Horticoccus luteus]
MKITLIRSLCAFALALVIGGCATTSVHYPVTYQVKVGNTQVLSGYGPQNIDVNARQVISVEPGVTFYYQVVSPLNVTVYVYEQTSSGERTLVSQMQGTAFTSSVMPKESSLEFLFSVTNANTSGSIQFTISDKPLTPVVTPKM